MRHDGYVNMLNKYGTSGDSSTAYEFSGQGVIPDMSLTEQYENNGLFAKIIDTPAEEAVKHGFGYGLKSPDVEKYINSALDRLDWEARASTAIKWSRLYGGAIGVMLINDGRGIDEPLNWRGIESIEEVRVYERAIVWPDYSSLYNYDPRDPIKSATSKFGTPERYQVQSMFGQFWAHESRCLVFRNGILPERTMNPFYRFWGMPEYVRIKNALMQAITTHGNASKLLERSVQAVYKMQGLAEKLELEGGDDILVRRLQAIDLARGLLNSIAIDAEGEDYDFKTFSFAGIREVIDATCNMLSALTNIPQTILFGRSPAGENSTGASDLENYYNYIERIQKLMLKQNLTTLLDVIVRSGVSHGDLDAPPEIELTFKPLWSLSETEQAAVDQQKASTQQVKAQTAQVYVDMGALGPSEVRKALADEESFSVEEMLDDMTEEELWGEGGEENWKPSGGEGPNDQLPPPESTDSLAALKGNWPGGKPGDALDELKVNWPEDDNDSFETLKENWEKAESGDTEALDNLKASWGKMDSFSKLKGAWGKLAALKRLKWNWGDMPNTDRADAGEVHGVGVLVVKDGLVLAGKREHTGEIGGPGGHIDPGEAPAAAAIREAQEEFGITPTSLKLLGRPAGLGDEYGEPYVYLCTGYEGDVNCSSPEMESPFWMSPDMATNLFPPFRESLKLLQLQGFKEKLPLTNESQQARIIIENNTDASSDDLDWVTLPNGVHVPVDDGGLTGRIGNNINAQSGGSSGNQSPEPESNESQEKASAATAKFSATGTNQSIPGMTTKNLNKHWGGASDHSNEYPGLTKEQYAERSLALARSEIGGDIIGYRAEDGAVVRYDKSENDWVKAYGTGPATLFKPVRGEDYYNENMIEDGGTTDD